MSKAKDHISLTTKERDALRVVSAETNRIAQEIIRQTSRLDEAISRAATAGLSASSGRGLREMLERARQGTHELMRAQEETLRRLQGELRIQKAEPPIRTITISRKDLGVPDGLRIRHSRDTAQLADRMLPEAPVPTRGQALQARRNAAARWSLLEEFGSYSSEEIAAERSQAKNRHALANRWRSEGRIFSVEMQGERRFPAFQFDQDLAPLPVVAEVLATLPRGRMSEWEAALWWAAANGWLAGRRPVDLIDAEPERIVEAAAHLSEPSPL